MNFQVTQFSQLKQCNRKMGKGLKWALHRKENFNSQYHTMKICWISLVFTEKQVENHHGTLLHTHQDGQNFKVWQQQVLAKIWINWIAYTSLMGLDICLTTLEKNFSSVSHVNAVHALRFRDVILEILTRESLVHWHQWAHQWAKIVHTMTVVRK